MRSKCKRMHRHIFMVEVDVEGEVDIGWIRDHGRMSGAIRPILAPLEHS